ncbi:uncharacterized protein LOC123683349 [Harmonia axyridis]|uniref:uncharacterized protein LOC123683349 n=1 Tax=Harmonia axyridis TaxID=115357 RepID=UPI001E27936E|nr:uncharacterized protein LOC123683349 [Harmonia axyridis]
MLPKDTGSSRRPRVAQNSSVSSMQKRKNCGTQTPKIDWERCSHIIVIDGKISKNDQDNYKKAVDFVNKWNDAMNDYLKKRSSKSKVKEMDEAFYFTPIPNYMSFFVTLQELDNRYLDATKPVRKNSYSQTKFPQEKIVVDVKSQTQYVKSTEDPNDVENIPKNIQLAQYGTYPHKKTNLQKSQRTQYSNFCPPLKHSARFSESNIRQTSSNRAQNDQPGYSPSAAAMNSSIRQNHSFANFNVTSSSVGRHKHPIPGLLSPNNRMAPEINGNMFGKPQNPLSVFVSQGNILKNISRSGSSSSSVILSDKDSEQLNLDDAGSERDDVERTSSPYGNERRYEGNFDHREASSGCEEEDTPVKQHPLNLNERDLNSKDKNFINSIGIFTEAGELKPNAKSYLETKEDVRKGTFRAPRLSQIHMTEHYNVKSCTSGSLLSDIVSTRSSEIDE